MSIGTRTAAWIDLTAAGAGALAGVGLALPREPGQALLGLTRDDPPVAGAHALRLPHQPDRVWWAGEALHLAREARRRGIGVARRWATTWTGSADGRVGPEPQVMGIVNVTPDSFSDGGRFLHPAAAVREIRRHRREGAQWVDIGGESTRPGHVPVSWEEEWDRLRPVVEALPPPWRASLSVDTRKPEVARRAAALGVGIVNDVGGGTAAMLEVLEDTRAAYVLMFNRTPPWASGELDWQTLLGDLAERLDAMRRRGIRPERVMVDPGLGFGYGVEDNLTVLAHLDVLRVLDRPVLVGASRKRFVGLVTGRPVPRRDAGSEAAAALACVHGADVVRAHRVAPTLDAVKMAYAVVTHG
jgi:dihydropteroate synthase